MAANHLIGSENLVWKTGVILERARTRAEVIEEYSQRRIRVRLIGPDQRGLLAIVDDHLEKLHRSFPRLQYDRYLPCPCEECRAKPEPYAFPLSNLQTMVAKGRQIQCHESGEMVDAAALIRDVLPSAMPASNDLEFARLKKNVTPNRDDSASEVFVSYAWTEESIAFVDRLQAALLQHSVRIIREREELRYKDSIRNFMTRLGQGKAIVTIISDKYLKSENCMFEMLEIARVGDLRNRAFPVVLADAKIYKASGCVRYVQYWEEQIRELDEGLKTLRGDSLSNLQKTLTQYAEIRRLFDDITSTLAT